MCHLACEHATILVRMARREDEPVVKIPDVSLMTHLWIVTFRKKIDVAIEWPLTPLL